MTDGPRVARFRRRIVGLLLLVYAAFVGVITLTPEMPGASVVDRAAVRLAAWLQYHGLPIHFLDIEFAGNILMFVPLGVLTAAWISLRAWWVLLFLGTAFSGAIELFQLVALPDRYPEWRDVLSNTIGFLIGAAVTVIVRLVVARRDRLVIADHEERQQRRRQTLVGTGPVRRVR